MQKEKMYLKLPKPVFANTVKVDALEKVQEQAVKTLTTKIDIDEVAMINDYLLLNGYTSDHQETADPTKLPNYTKVYLNGLVKITLENMFRDIHVVINNNINLFKVDKMTLKTIKKAIKSVNKTVKIITTKRKKMIRVLKKEEKTNAKY